MFLSAVFAPRMEDDANHSNSDSFEHQYDTFGDGLIINGVRSRKKIADLQPCPVCCCTIRANELHTHFSQELERLSKLSSPSGSSKRKMPPLPVPNQSTAGSSTSTAAPEVDADVTGCVGGDVYKKVRLNRLRRLRRSRRRSAGSRGDGGPSSSCDASGPLGSCPICKVSYPMRRLQRHALRCLRDSGEGNTSSMSDVSDTSSEDGTIDVEGDGASTTVEPDTAPTGGRNDMLVYEWCGQERIRATALRALEERRLFTATSPTQQEDVLQTLVVVDGDEDEELYGPPQFSPTLLAIRDDCLPEDTWSGEGGAALMAASQRQEPYPEIDAHTEPRSERRPDDAGQGSGAHRTLIQALRQQLKELEKSQANHAKCHICLSPYTDPVVSIQCWHVHCEVCWVDALRAKKTCPQCMAITTTHHLRRIYI